MNYKQIYKIKSDNEKRILSVCPDCPKTSGIYFLLREEDGFKYGYIGQAKCLLSRLGQHLSGYQHIDLSIKKHGFYSEDNPTGYRVNFLEFPVSELDEKEQHFIRKYANAGYQMRNKTSGSQGKGKQGIAPNRPSRNYYDGLSQGEKNLAKKLKHIVDTHLVISLKKDTKTSQKALQKFYDLLEK